MTVEDRVAAVQRLGFTERQARFLTTVLRHGGVCVPRQFTTVAGIAFGQATRVFFARLVAEGWARSYACWLRGGTYVHVHHKALYRAVGDPESAYRRSPTIPRVVERLMLLDVVIGARELRWLASAGEKTAYFHRERTLPLSVLPVRYDRRAGERIARYFPDGWPVGIGDGGKVVLVYFPRVATRGDVEHFVVRHLPLIGQLQQVTVRLVMPGFMATSEADLRAVALRALSLTVRPLIVDEFLWYCGMRRAREHGSVVAQADVERFARSTRAFAATRFQLTYCTWCTAGDAAVDALRSTRVAEAVARGDVRVETQIMRGQYLRLAKTLTRG